MHFSFDTHNASLCSQIRNEWQQYTLQMNQNTKQPKTHDSILFWLMNWLTMRHFRFCSSKITIAATNASQIYSDWNIRWKLSNFRNIKVTATLTASDTRLFRAIGRIFVAVSFFRLLHALALDRLNSALSSVAKLLFITNFICESQTVNIFFALGTATGRFELVFSSFSDIDVIYKLI